MIEPGEIAAEPIRPRFKLGVTIVCAVVVALAMGWLYFSDAKDGRESKLDDPERDLQQVMGRQLDAEEWVPRLPAWQRWLGALQGDKSGETLKESIAAYQSYTAKFSSPSSTRTLVVLLAEAGRLTEAQKELDGLKGSLDEEEFITVVRYAYWPNGKASPPPRLKTLLAEIHPAWARDKLEKRVAGRHGEAAAARAAQARIEGRGQPIQQRMVFLNVVSTLLMLTGLIFLAGWARRRFAGWPLGGARELNPWSGASGLAVLVRGEALGQLLAFPLSALTPKFLSLLNGVNSLLTALPMLILGSKYLLQPVREKMRSCFGLGVPLKSWGQVFLLGLALTGVSSLGESIIGALTAWLGFEGSWAEFMPEELLWKSWGDAGLDTLNTVICAPICEEIVFRGFLYGTLRTRFSISSAALLSSVLFSLGHGYSIDGFLTTAWSGFIWAVSYEKTRSLLPGMVSHALGNALVSITWVLLFRI